MVKKLLFGLIGVALVSVLFTACTIRDASTLNTGPKVMMGPSTFITTTKTIKKGQTITMVNTSANQHILVNGEWKGATPVTTTEPGAPKLSMNIQGNQTTSTPAFTTAGTYHIYCTIHGGMNLVVTVQ
ncbi:MAG TPA: plastocyanin/azurin family copper-binding protein [Ktedonobacteraceae bacterium]|jgi:plastocyanin|nr:plastocyanin/azurin family copper-binding protein [Ktedonobacteraceae bacterium]